MLILEGVVQRDNPGVIRHGQHIALRPHVPHLILAHHGLFDHGLHCVHFPVGLLLDEADLREGGREGGVNEISVSYFGSCAPWLP